MTCSELICVVHMSVDAKVAHYSLVTAPLHAMPGQLIGKYCIARVSISHDADDARNASIHGGFEERGQEAGAGDMPSNRIECFKSHEIDM